jgi:hypothetical protein
MVKSQVSEAASAVGVVFARPRYGAAGHGHGMVVERRGGSRPGRYPAIRHSLPQAAVLLSAIEGYRNTRRAAISAYANKRGAEGRRCRASSRSRKWPRAGRVGGLLRYGCRAPAVVTVLPVQ